MCVCVCVSVASRFRKANKGKGPRRFENEHWGVFSNCGCMLHGVIQWVVCG